MSRRHPLVGELSGISAALGQVESAPRNVFFMLHNYQSSSRKLRDTTPFFTSDKWSAYPNALLRTDGEWYQPTRQGRRGPHPALRCRPRPNWL